MDSVDQYLGMAFTNPYTKSILTLFLVLYGGLAAPKLPDSLLKLFDNQIFRIIILALIVYMGQKDAMFAIMIAVAFVISMNTLNQKKIKKKMKEKFGFWGDLEKDANYAKLLVCGATCAAAIADDGIFPAYDTACYRCIAKNGLVEFVKSIT